MRTIGWSLCLVVFYLAGLGLVGWVPPAQAVDLVYSTFLAGSRADEARAVAVDAAGNAYVAGLTQSPDFPVPGAPPPPDSFVFKLDPSGALVYARGLRGMAVSAIAVDAAGSLYLTGGASGDAFVAKLDPSGSVLLYSTRLGGSGTDFGEGLAVDAQGSAYVTGTTDSFDFPTVNPISASRGALYWDAFVAKLSPGGTELVYSTYLGGSSSDHGRAIGVDAAGNAYVAGYTYSPDFPTVHALKSANPGPAIDGFVAKIHPSGKPLLYSTYLGGSSGDYVWDLAANAAGHVWVTGSTESPDFPTAGALQPYRGGNDAFATHLSPGGALISSTFLGGPQWEGGWGIALDPAGAVWISGGTSSVGFPLVHPIVSSCVSAYPGEPCSIAFATRLDARGATILDSTLLGGSWGEIGWDVAADHQGNAVVVGTTLSPDFPIVNALQPTRGEGFDGFAAKLAPSGRPPVCTAATASPAVLWPPDGKLRPVTVRGVTDPDGDPVSITINSIRQDEPLSRKSSPDGSGIGTSTAQVRADRLGQGDGRVYHLGFTAVDGRGGSCAGEVTVCVPHDAARKTCGDGGALQDSTGAP
ncbi:MAG TPA: SBBP repeat-containing protein [Thermoanaerobaculia bacterium]|nr:SBBP repeat-containing protein [Thermoanaerobaculia bacterium]